MKELLKQKKPLVSIVVISFNAEAYIIDTLNSIKAQTYKNIELIVSDDCSKDRTMNVVTAWISDNYNRFSNVELVSTDINGGVVKNCNNGCKRAKGEWIKLIAGDDMLPYDAIENYVDSVTQNSISTIICTQSATFIKKNNKYIITDLKPDAYTAKAFHEDPSRQYKRMLYEYVIFIPISSFISKKFYEKYDYYDESFPEIEDQPFMLKISRNGEKISYDSSFIGYLHRSNINSASQTVEGIMNKRAFSIGGLQHKQDIKFVLPYIPRYHILFYLHYYWDLLRRRIVIDVLGNKNNAFTMLVNKFFLFFDYVFMKKKIYNFFHSNDEKKRNQIKEANDKYFKHI